MGLTGFFGLSQLMNTLKNIGTKGNIKNQSNKAMKTTINKQREQKRPKEITDKSDKHLNRIKNNPNEEIA
jgi:hypothetical protein